MKPLCIYHGNCDDGFASAAVVRRALGAANVDFYPGVYQQEPPDVRGRDVVLVDFSYKRPVLEAMQKTAGSILILDHHKTAAEDLAGIERHPLEWQVTSNWDCKTEVVFDMARSGAGIAWDHYNPGKPRPTFIDYIEDRDLWRKVLPGGDEFTIALRSYPQDFGLWDAMIDAGAQSLIDQGAPIQRYYRQRVGELKRSSYMASIPYPGKLGHFHCKIANAPYFAASEVAGELAQDDGAQFGACYFEVRAGEYQYSLRSRTDFDVSEVAKLFGGGGHKGAAGFTVPAPVHRALSI